MTDRERKFKIIRLANFLPLSETESRHEPSTCPTRYRLGIPRLVAELTEGLSLVARQHQKDYNLSFGNRKK